MTMHLPLEWLKCVWKSPLSGYLGWIDGGNGRGLWAIMKQGVMIGNKSLIQMFNTLRGLLQGPGDVDMPQGLLQISSRLG